MKAHVTDLAGLKEHLKVYVNFLMGFFYLFFYQFVLHGEKQYNNLQETIFVKKIIFMKKDAQYSPTN